ncbi:MAG: DUF554 domain-containing protein [Candidatus Dormibacteraeota bacterium]|uniref:DUF554 domain-containing protein n=1 Tax=Candidatus Aeolococcus gillhamiae TaxID=3127015 RepID=A0A934JTF2_9BACT|nr:DUF554 domain-containing protein [Candidatus Dormibacteraeota bacterium]
MGTLLNTATVLTGGAIGIRAGDRIPARVRESLIAVLGLFTMVYGFRTALSPAFNGSPAPDLALVLLALLVGTAVGSALDLDGRLQRLGAAIEARIGRAAPDGRMAHALVTTSLLFCVGPLTILGSFEDGARGDILLLGIKSALDGVAALIFGASLGAGVLLSAVTVLVVQGSLTAAAYFSRGVLDPVLTTAALGAGGFMLIAIALGLLNIRRLRVPDMLPALVIAPLVALAARGWHIPI